MIDYTQLAHHERRIMRTLRQLVPGFGDEIHDHVSIERHLADCTIIIAVRFRGEIFRDSINEPFAIDRADWRGIGPSHDTVNRMLLIA